MAFLCPVIQCCVISTTSLSYVLLLFVSLIWVNKCVCAYSLYVCVYVRPYIIKSMFISFKLKAQDMFAYSSYIFMLLWCTQINQTKFFDWNGRIREDRGQYQYILRIINSIILMEWKLWLDQSRPLNMSNNLKSRNEKTRVTGFNIEQDPIILQHPYWIWIKYLQMVYWDVWWTCVSCRKRITQILWYS